MNILKEKTGLFLLSIILSLFVSLDLTAGIDPAFITIGHDTGAQNGRRCVRDSAGFYHAVVSDPATTTFEVLDSTDTWGEWWLTTPGPWAPCQFPSLAIDLGDMLHMVWSDGLDIHYSNTPAGINMWSPPIQLSSSQWVSIYPSIDCDSAGTIHVVWQDVDRGPNWGDEILYSASIDGGISFSTPVNITNNQWESERPCVACPYDWSAGQAHVCWDECGQSGFQVYHTATSDNGVTWTATALVSQIMPGVPDISGLFACMVVDEWDNPHITYSHGSSWGDILYNRSTDGGLTFGSMETVAVTSNDFPTASLAIDPDGVLRVLWHDGDYSFRTLYYSYKEPTWDAWTAATSFDTLDYHNASYVYKNQLNRGGLAIWTDGPYGSTNIQGADCPPLIIRLDNTPTSARPGQTISWTVSVQNRTSITQTFNLWIEARTPMGATVTRPFGTYSLPAHATGSGTMPLTLPGAMPLGNYVVSVVAGSTGTEDWDRDAFILNVY